MGFYKWIFKKATGIELVDPDPNYVPETNDAEEFLNSNPDWPKRVKGNINLIDVIGDEEHSFYWAIGTLEIPGFKKPILIEFKEKVLISSGLSKLAEFPKEICVWVSPTDKEYYQVNQVEKT